MKSPIAILYDSVNSVILMGQKLMAGSLPVTVASDQTPASNSATTGTIVALNGVVSAAVQGWSSCTVVITGTWSATLVFELSCDGGTTWVQGAFVVPPAVTAPMPSPLLTLTANGTYQGVGLGAVTNVRVRASAYTSGTVNVRLVFSVATAGLIPGFSAIQQNVVASLSNNSTANLAAGASFTGTGESTLGIVGIQANLKADQPCNVSLQQSQDNTNWDLVDTVLVSASTGFGQTFQATASYFRMVVTNVGGFTTTYFRLQVALCPVVEAVPRVLGPSGGMKTEPAVSCGSWLPTTPGTFFGLSRGQRAPLTVGADGSLQCYSQVLTDAGSFREDYPGSSLQSNLTGTMYFTSGSTLVTGVGCAFTTQLNRFSFIKLTGHADTVLASVLNVVDDNVLTLTAAYTGASGSGVGIQSGWFLTIGTGGSTSVANSILAIVSGTTATSKTWVQRGSDYGPMEFSIRFSASQRIANQTIRMGFFDNFASPTIQATVELTGTDNTQVTLVTRSSSNASDVESVTVTLPTGINTGTILNLKIDLHNDRVMLYYDPTDGSPPVFLALCKNHIPPPYVSLLSGHGFLNGTTPAITTTLNVDVVYLNDYNLLATSIEESIAPDQIAAVCTNVAAAVADTSLLAANKYRLGATITNDSVATLYLKLGTGASATSHTVQIPRGGYYELPFGYNQAVNGYWSAALGSARVTEIA
jgi:hypothetical protein